MKEEKTLQPGDPIPVERTGGMEGFVVGECGHRVAGSEWRAGFRNCERCGENKRTGDNAMMITASTPRPENATGVRWHAAGVNWEECFALIDAGPEDYDTPMNGEFTFDADLTGNADCPCDGHVEVRAEMADEAAHQARLKEAGKQEEEPRMSTYTYAIEISDNGEIWMPENDSAIGTGQSGLSAENYAHLVLVNRLEDSGMLGDPGEHVRVVVWEGARQDTMGMAAAVATRVAYPA